jgi:hypothetical protein
MSDLVSMQPDIRIDLFMVASDKRPEDDRLSDPPAHLLPPEAALAPA